MSDRMQTKHAASVALLRLIDQRINPTGVSHPLELAAEAIDAIAKHALGVAQRHYAAVIAHNLVDEQPTTPVPPDVTHDDVDHGA